MRITLIITGLSTGGAETMLLKTLERIDRDYFQPHVISLTDKGEIGPRIEALGIPVDALNLKPCRPNLLKFIKLLRCLRSYRPEIVHTWMYHADLLGGLAARLAGIHSVAWGIRHSNLSPGQNKRSTLMVMKACAILSDWLPHRILTCSERALEVHVAAGYRSDKMALIPNGFDLARFQPDAAARESVRAELDLPSDTPLIGLIARADPQKNHAGFIVAAALVHKVLPQVHFVLAGSGIDQGNGGLLETIACAGLLDRFHLLGRRDDIPRLMASLDVLASSSNGEAFPNVLGEAMACGVPCVVTDVGDSAYIVGRTGRVVASNDMVGLAKGLIELLDIPILDRVNLGLGARNRVAELFEIGSVVKRYEKLYKEMAHDME